MAGIGFRPAFRNALDTEHQIAHRHADTQNTGHTLGNHGFVEIHAAIRHDGPPIRRDQSFWANRLISIVVPVPSGIVIL
jgi:hypothetical protein